MTDDSPSGALSPGVGHNRDMALTLDRPPVLAPRLRISAIASADGTRIRIGRADEN
jgi:hypothetical protein